MIWQDVLDIVSKMSPLELKEQVQLRPYNPNGDDPIKLLPVIAIAKIVDMEDPEVPVFNSNKKPINLINSNFAIYHDVWGA